MFVEPLLIVFFLSSSPSAWDGCIPLDTISCQTFELQTYVYDFAMKVHGVSVLINYGKRKDDYPLYVYQLVDLHRWRFECLEILLDGRVKRVKYVIVFTVLVRALNNVTSYSYSVHSDNDDRDV